MSQCSRCERIATWECTICNVVLCSNHKRTHNDDDLEHCITKLKLKCPEYLKKKVLASLSAKISLIDQSSNMIIKSSEIIAEQFNILSKGMLSKLEEQRKKYLHTLKLLDSEITEDLLIFIDKEGETVLVYEKSESGDEYRWYDQEILKEKSDACYSRGELLRLGRDLIEEVLERSLVSLENNNISAGKIGTNKDSHGIYHGEIENGVPDGRGSMYYYIGAIYSGELCDGRIEGTGVYTYDSGDIYDGGWKNGLKEGTGILKYPSGDIYNGEWKNGLQEGTGVLRYASGDIYHDGQWQAGKIKN